ncbi:MAG: type IX secretion system sortase PorU [Raineya sp.]|nr:type IX secretion system sortase PorU [Raineya sp.]
MKIGFTLVLGLFFFSALAQNSVLSSGKWYKIAVTQRGLHKITAQNLREWGIDISQINPKNIAIYGNGGGMLPQPNNAPRIADLQENAILVVGEEDNQMDNGDYILFYAQNADKIIFNPATQRFSHEKNLYDDRNYYFLTIKNSAGLRVQNQASVSASQNINTFDDYFFHEKDQFNILNQLGRGGSGREWYGEFLNAGQSVEISNTIEGLVPNSTLFFTSSVLNQSFNVANFQVAINGQIIGSQNVSPIFDATYSTKGIPDLAAFSLNTNQIPSLPQFKVTYNLQGSNVRGYLNFFGVQSKRELRLYGNQTAFRSIESRSLPAVNFIVGNANSSTQIWDITNPLEPKNQLFTLSGSQAIFGAVTNGVLKEFLVWQGADFPTPTLVGEVANQNLRALPTPNLLIITHPNFREQAERLAEFRRTHDGFSVAVADVFQIYNEFSSGRQDVTALRDFIRHLYLKTPNTLKYVLLFGAASFDYKDRVPNNTNFVPIYESRESLHPIFSYSSDDYFGFMESTEGEWIETFSNIPTFDHTLDVGVGRLPVQTAEQARNVVDKLIAYANRKENLGDWRKRVVFLADDGDANQHQIDSDRLAQKVEDNYPNFNVQKIYLDAYPQISSGGNERSPACKAAFTDAIEKGALVVNFTGHGGEIGWTQEEILRTPDIKTWNNGNHLPLMITATCEFGRYDEPSALSGAEVAILEPNRGAIALITTTRPVFSSTNFILNDQIYNFIFEPIAGKMPCLGDIMRLTKNNSLAGSVNRNFSLLGDPSMKLAYPEKRVVITHLNGKDITIHQDTLKALDKVTLEGEIRDENDVFLPNFNGILDATIWDKVRIKSTLGTQSTSPMNFWVRDVRLFNGKVSVRNGRFRMQFVMPKNINYAFGNGKISLYAADIQNLVDAGTGKTDIVVGGSNPNPLADNTPPRIRLYMNDETFKSGGLVNENPLLLAYLYDENGINISSVGIGQDITAYLNDSIQKPYILNDFYTADLDSYQSGKVVYPFRNLPEGRYTLTLKVWDTYNNSAEEKIEFVVASSKSLRLQNVMNYPNPFSERTTFSFEHNRFHEDLEIELEIFNLQGEKMLVFRDKVFTADANVSKFVLDLNGYGTKFANGIYMYRLSVRSLKDTQKATAVGKLVVMRNF